MNRSTGRRARKLQQTADRLVATAWSLFEAQGFDNVTMEAIADAADVAKGTLYNHFPVKEALLCQAFHQQLQQQRPRLLEALDQLPAGTPRLRGFFSIIAEWSEARRDYLPHYLRSRMTDQGRNRNQRSGTDRIFTLLIEAGIESGEFRSELSPTFAVHYLSFLFFGALVRWLDQPDSPLMEELERMLDLFTNGIQASEKR
jgi:AcrR family transcriptional regulator